MFAFLGALTHSGSDQPRTDHVGTNAARCIIRGNRTSEADYRALAGRIRMCRKIIIAAHLPQHRRNVDNDAPFSIEHRLQGVFTTVKNAVQIQVKCFLPAFECTRVGGAITPFTPAPACDVDEDVDVIINFQYLLNGSFDFECRGHIHAKRMLKQRRQSWVGVGIVDIKADNAPALLRKQLRRGQPDPASTASDDGDLILKTVHSQRPYTFWTRER